jgi:hypothetical protein
MINNINAKVTLFEAIEKSQKELEKGLRYMMAQRGQGLSICAFLCFGCDFIECGAWGKRLE